MKEYLKKNWLKVLRYLLEIVTVVMFMAALKRIGGYKSLEISQNAMNLLSQLDADSLDRIFSVFAITGMFIAVPVFYFLVWIHRFLRSIAVREALRDYESKRVENTGLEGNIQ